MSPSLPCYNVVHRAAAVLGGREDGFQFLFDVRRWLRKTLQVRDDGRQKGQLVVEGLSEAPVGSAREAIAMVTAGLENRKVGGRGGAIGDGKVAGIEGSEAGRDGKGCGSLVDC